MKDEEIKLEPEEREREWGGRDQQEGLWTVVDEVGNPSSTILLPDQKRDSFFFDLLKVQHLKLTSLCLVFGF